MKYKYSRKVESKMFNDVADKVSIIIPAYNVAEHLPRCLDSVLAQTYKNLEVIVVNDGSKDNSEAVIKEYVCKDTRVNLISKINEGVTKARLTGIAAATGTWIGFVDGDDYIEPEMYEVLLTNAKKHNADISHCGYQMVFPSRVVLYYNTGKLIEQDNKKGLIDLFEGTFVEPALWNKLYKKSLCETLIRDDLVDFSIKINEDTLMNYYLFRQSSKSVYYDKCYYNYVLRKNSATTSTINENKLRDPIKVRKIIRDSCDDENIERLMNGTIASYLIYTITLNDRLNPALINQYKKEAKKELKTILPKIIKGNYSFKRKLCVLWVAIWPWSYKVVRDIYAKITGTDKQYEIN